MNDSRLFATYCDLQVGELLDDGSTSSKDSVRVEVSSDQAGWFAIGISSDGTMTSSGSGSDVVVCDNQGARRFFVKEMSSSQFVAARAASIPGATCTIDNANGGSLVFTRPRASQAATERAFPVDTDVRLIFAGSSDERTVSFHFNQKFSAKANLLTGDSGSGGATITASTPVLVWLHIVCMLLSWGALLPAGVLFSRCQVLNFSTAASMCMQQ